MQNFEFHAYTDMLFGEGQIEKLPEVLARYGKKSSFDLWRRKPQKKRDL